MSEKIDYSSTLKQTLDYNRSFVEKKQYEAYKTSKYPNKKIAIVTCMDTRLTELLPAALGIKNGDAKIIKNAGGLISHPFGSAVRSLLIAVYELQVNEILVIGHTDCGVQHMDSDRMLEHMRQRGIPKEKIELAQDFGLDLNHWLKGFEDVNTSVHNSVELLLHHPLMPSDVSIYGYVMDSVTGEMTYITGRSAGKEFPDTL